MLVYQRVPRISWNQQANLWKITDTQAASTLSAMEAAEAALVAAAAARQAEGWEGHGKKKDIRYIKIPSGNLT